jgi:hypothetical protein
MAVFAETVQAVEGVPLAGSLVGRIEGLDLARRIDAVTRREL